MSEDYCPGTIGAYPPSCNRRHICPDTDQRVAEATREYVARMRSDDVTGWTRAYIRLLDAVDAQVGETPRDMANNDR